MRQDRIRRYATAFMVLLGAYTLFYPYSSISGLIDYAFLYPERMVKSRFTGGFVSDGLRWGYFWMWLTPVIAGIYGCVAALYLANLCRVGRYFDERFARGLYHLGAAVIASLVTDILATSFTPKLLSWINPAGPLDVRWRFQSEETGLVLCGIGFCALGWVMQEAVKIAEENDGFV